MLALTLLQPELFVKKRGTWTSFQMASAKLYSDLSSLSAEVRSEAPGRSEDGGLDRWRVVASHDSTTCPRV